MIIENFCRMVSGVEKAQKKAAVLYEAGMETSRAFEMAGLYEALLNARILEMRIYRALDGLAMVICGVGTGVFWFLLFQRGHNVPVVISAIASFAGMETTEWFCRKIKATRLKIRRLDRFLAKKGPA